MLSLDVQDVEIHHLMLVIWDDIAFVDKVLGTEIFE